MSGLSDHAFRPSLTEIGALRPVVTYLDKLGPPSIRRWIAERIPWTAFQECKAVIDTMDLEARKIVEERSDAVRNPDKSVSRENEGKDLFTVLSKWLR